MSVAIHPLTISRERTADYFAAKGYQWQDGELKLNLVGYRNSLPQVNAFCDVLACHYRLGGQWVTHWWPATTDPGVYWLRYPSKPEGTEILVPGQYRNSWTVGTRGDYVALIQVGNVRVWRDADRDAHLDPNKSVVYEGNDFGIDIHRAMPQGVAPSVAQWAAGGQVLQSARDFDALMSLVFRSATLWGKFFTYTLVCNKDMQAVLPPVG